MIGLSRGAPWCLSIAVAAVSALSMLASPALGVESHRDDQRPKDVGVNSVDPPKDRGRDDRPPIAEGVVIGVVTGKSEGREAQTKWIDIKSVSGVTEHYLLHEPQKSPDLNRAFESVRVGDRVLAEWLVNDHVRLKSIRLAPGAEAPAWEPAFPLPTERPYGAKVTLKDGSVVIGRVSAVDDKRITVQTWYREVSFPVAEVKSVEPDPGEITLARRPYSPGGGLMDEKKRALANKLVESSIREDNLKGAQMLEEMGDANGAMLAYRQAYHFYKAALVANTVGAKTFVADFCRDEMFYQKSRADRPSPERLAMAEKLFNEMDAALRGDKGWAIGTVMKVADDAAVAVVTVEQADPGHAYMQGMPARFCVRTTEGVPEPKMHGDVSRLRQGDRLRIHFSWAGFVAIDMMGKTEEKRPATMEKGNQGPGGGGAGG